MSDESQKLPWTVKGIDPALREQSRKPARKMGLRIASWVSLTLAHAAQREEPPKPPEPDQSNANK
jgi:hypothetical protein